MKNVWYEAAGGMFAAYSYVVTMLYGGTVGANGVHRIARQVFKIMSGATCDPQTDASLKEAL